MHAHILPYSGGPSSMECIRQLLTLTNPSQYLTLTRTQPHSNLNPSLDITALSRSLEGQNVLSTLCCKGVQEHRHAQITHAIFHHMSLVIADLLINRSLHVLARRQFSSLLTVRNNSIDARPLNFPS